MNLNQTAQRLSIYALTDPKTGEHFYIGATQYPGQRRSQHLGVARRVLPHGHGGGVHERLAQMLADGREPTLEVLETAPVATGWHVEAAWVDECRSRGCPLVNRSRPTVGPWNTFQRFSKSPESPA